MKIRHLLLLFVAVFCVFGAYAGQDKKVSNAHAKYVWQSNNNNSSEGAKYDANVTDALGCSAGLAAASTYICYGSCTQLTASYIAAPAAPYNYKWTASCGTPALCPAPANVIGSAATSSTPMVCPSATTTYTVTITNASACSSIASVIVQVDPKINVSISPASATYCANSGAAVTATVTVSGGSGISYTYNWVPVAGANAQTGTVTAATGSFTSTFTPAATTSYTVFITDNAGSSTSCQATASFIVKYSNLTTAITAPQSVCPGITATVTATPSNVTGTASYVWIPGGAITSSINVSGTTPGTTTYSVTVTDGGGCPTTASTTVTILPGLTVPGNPGTTCAGHPYGINAAVAGCVTCTYVWTSTTAPAPPNGTSAASSTPTVTPTTTTTYNVTVTDAGGCSGTQTITVSIAAGLTISMPGGTDCPTAPFVLTASGAGGTATYVWSASSGPAIPSGTSNTVTVNPSTATTYTVSVTDAGGCSGTQTCVVTMSPPLAIALNSGTDCAGAPYTLTASGASATATYVWSASSGPAIPSGTTGSIIVNPAVATTYSVTVTDVSGCTGSQTAIVTMKPPLTIPAFDNTVCSGNPVSLDATPGNGTGPYTYSWTSSSTFTAATNPVSVSPTTATTYYVTVTDAQGCSGTKQGVVTMKPPLTIPAFDNTVCSGNPVSLDATPGNGTGPYTYSWTSSGTFTAATNPVSVSPTTATTYYVTVTDAQGCSGTKQGVVTMKPPLTIPAFDNTVCSGNPVSLTATPGNGTGPYTYNWTDNLGSFTSGANPLTVSPTTTTTYYVSVTDAQGCSGTKQGVVTMRPPLVIPIQTPSICAGNSTTISATPSNGTPGFTYHWSDNSALNPLTTPILNANATYCVSVTDAQGCSGTQCFTVVVNPIPVADAGPDQYMCPGATVTLGGSPTGTVSNGDAVTYSWTPAAGLVTPTSSNPTISGLSAAGSPYTYTVQVTDAVTGCFTTDNVIVTVARVDIATTATPSVICQGQSSNICATPTINPASVSSPVYAYSWSANPADASLTGPPGTCETVSPTITTTYTVTVTESVTGCSSTNTVIVAVNPSPSVVFGPPISICQNDPPVFFNPTYTNTSVPSYQWSGCGTTPSGQNPVVPATPAGTCIYIVTVTNAGGCYATASILVTVYDLPVAAAGLPTTICKGDSVVLGTFNASFVSTTATGGGVVTGTTPTYSYAWVASDAGLPTPLGANPKVEVPTITTKFSLTVTDSYGCTGTSNVTISVNPTPTVTGTLAPVCPGTTVDLSTYILVNGAAPSATDSYVWATTSGLGLSCSGCMNANVTMPNNTATPVFTVTVTDPAGCTGTGSVTLKVPTLLSASPTATAATCGNANGQATANQLGGTPPYTYLWCNGQTNATATGLSGGTSCNLTVTDAGGCFVVTVVTINNSGGANLSFDPALIKDVTCAGSCNGQAVVDIKNGGVAPFTYKWSAGTGYGATNSSGSASGICVPAGSSITLFVTVTDANNCPTIADTIIKSPAMLVLTLTPNSPTCNADLDGGALATVSGGTPAYTYNWSNGKTTVNITTGAGTYSVTITDANSCSTVGSVTITAPPVVTATETINSNVTCSGACNGQITVTQGGGVPGYTYNWSDIGTGPSSRNNLCSGTYSVTVYDSHNCFATASATITEPPLITATYAVVQAACNQNNGSISVTATGGTGAFTFAWSASSSGGSTITSTATTSTYNNIPAGNYTVTFTDGHSCSSTMVISVSNSGGPIISITPSNVTTPGGSDGKVTVNITSGGTAPFTYAWSNGTTDGPTASGGDAITGLTSGNYCVTVSDANNCQAITCAAVSEPLALTDNPSFTKIPCAGGNSTLCANAVGGNATPTYTWSNGGPNTDCITVVAGTYSVTVTDGVTTLMSTITVTEPPQITGSITINQALNCSYDLVGSLSAAPGGGSPIYFYLWANSGGTFSKAQTINNLGPDNYTVTITDSKGCNTVVVQTLTTNPAITLTVTTNPTSCNGPGYNDGSAIVNIAGGVPMYTAYTPPTTAGPGNSPLNIPNLSSGGYSVTVTDSKGCTATANYVVSAPSIVNVVESKLKDPTCYKGSDGCVDVVISGGGAFPYSYAFIPVVPGAVTTTAALTATYCGLPSGTYVCIVTDANGCSIATPPTTLTDPPVVQASITAHTDTKCALSCDGTATASAVGGTGPYSFSWSDPLHQATATATSLCNGTYSVVITDKFGCSYAPNSIASVTIGSPLPLTGVINPSSNSTKCNGSKDVTLICTPLNGTATYSFIWGDVTGTVALPPPINTATLSPVGAGTYVCTITDQNGCTFVAAAPPISEPTPVGVTFSQNDVTCSGYSDGNATATGNGGTAPSGQYFYVWNTVPPQNTQTATGLAGNPGGGGKTYIVTVTDANGCTGTGQVTITEPAAIVVTFGPPTMVSCNGFSDGSVSVSAQFGTPIGGTDYKYTWSNGHFAQGPNDVNGGLTGSIAGTTYSVTATDSRGCTGTNQVVINEPTAITVTNVTPTPRTICQDLRPAGTFGKSSSTLTASANGGSGFYNNFQWSSVPNDPSIGGQNGNNGIIVNPTVTTTYTVSVYDNSVTGNCYAVDTVIVNVLQPLNVTLTESAAFTCEHGKAVVLRAATHTGGNGNYTYLWSGFGVPVPSTAGANDSITLNPTIQGTYVYTVQLSDQCTYPEPTQSVTLVVYPQPIFNIAENALQGCTPFNFHFSANDSLLNSADTHYQWTVSLNGVQQNILTAATDTFPHFSDLLQWDYDSDVQRNGQLDYDVKLSAVTIPGSPYSCSKDTNFTVTVFEIPKFDIAPDPEYVEILDVLPYARMHVVHRDNYSNYDSLYWDMGDPKNNEIFRGTTGVGHQYPGVGIYHVKLIVNKHGCQDIEYRDVVVKPKTEIWIPDAFTPNGDGINDLFEPKGINVTAYEMYIYDRWGTLVYGSGSLSKPWNGNGVNGAPIPQDVYVYKIIITDADGTKLPPFVGRVTLIR